LLKREEIIQRKFKDIQTGGEAPRRVQTRGAAPRGEWPFAIDVIRERDNHIDVIDVY
jgi:hypothetical protein